MSLPHDKDPPAPHQGEEEEEPEEEDEKGHTFRKRRLTLPMLNLQELKAGTIKDQHHDDLHVQDKNVKSADNKLSASDVQLLVLESSNVHESELDASPIYDEKEKSKTFRKRRLSMTSQSVQESMPIQADFEISLNDVDRESQGRDHKRRRMSEVSHDSIMSTSTTGSMSRSRIHHADEIVRHPSSPSIGNVDTSRLYTGPHNFDQYRYQGKQPRWKRRMTRRHSDDERKLPFPRDVVGLYSCHGIEPVYRNNFVEEDVNDDDDDDDDDEDDDGDDDHDHDHDHDDETWGNEIPSLGGNKNSVTQRQFRVTASAKINQDRGGVAFPYGDTPRTALFAVYDGHGQGGELVSQYSLHHVQQKLKRHPNFKDDLAKAFRETFIEVDQDLASEPSIEPLYAGTTACVALIRDNVLTLSNAGDSRAVLARIKTSFIGNNMTSSESDISWEAIPLTVDQNPDHPEEQARIERFGGFVSPPPEPGLSARVWLDSSCSQIGLAMSRSIGDHVVKSVGVIAEPVVTSHVLTENDDFLILASDGVWEFISSEEAVEIVGSHLSKGATKACQALIEAAANKWHQEEGNYRDDITALVIRVQMLWNGKGKVEATKVR